MARIPNERRTYLWQRFVGIKTKHPFPNLVIPKSPEEAASLAFQKGLQVGYGEGLVDGVGLGVDISTSAEATTSYIDDDILTS